MMPACRAHADNNPLPFAKQATCLYSGTYMNPKKGPASPSLPLMKFPPSGFSLRGRQAARVSRVTVHRAVCWNSWNLGK